MREWVELFEYATSFLCAVWLLFPTKTEFFVQYCSSFWIECLFQAFKEIKRQFLHHFLCACTYFRHRSQCVSCFVFFLSVLLLGSIVQFMHTLHSLFRGQLQFNSIWHCLHEKHAVGEKKSQAYKMSCKFTRLIIAIAALLINHGAKDCTVSWSSEVPNAYGNEERAP